MLQMHRELRREGETERETETAGETEWGERKEEEWAPWGSGRNNQGLATSQKYGVINCMTLDTVSKDSNKES